MPMKEETENRVKAMLGKIKENMSYTSTKSCERKLAKESMYGRDQMGNRARKMPQQGHTYDRDGRERKKHNKSCKLQPAN